MTKLCDYEKELLEKLHYNRDIPWGAAVGVGLEFLRNSGYITQYVGAVPKLTTKGLAALNDWIEHRYCKTR